MSIKSGIGFKTNPANKHTETMSLDFTFVIVRMNSNRKNWKVKYLGQNINNIK